MTRQALGLAALAVALAVAPSRADPAAADLWIGLPGVEDGFLLDTNTGRLWMTGACLRSLEPAVNTGEVWTSRTVSLVSVGRALDTVDQTFALDVRPTRPQITVINPDRGGAHSFDAQLVTSCPSSAACRARAQQPACAD